MDDISVEDVNASKHNFPDALLDSTNNVLEIAPLQRVDRSELLVGNSGLDTSLALDAMGVVHSKSQTFEDMDLELEKALLREIDEVDENHVLSAIDYFSLDISTEKKIVATIDDSKTDESEKILVSNIFKVSNECRDFGDATKATPEVHNRTICHSVNNSDLLFKSGATDIPTAMDVDEDISNVSSLIVQFGGSKNSITAKHDNCDAIDNSIGIETEQPIDCKDTVGAIPNGNVMKENYCGNCQGFKEFNWNVGCSMEGMIDTSIKTNYFIGDIIETILDNVFFSHEARERKCKHKKLSLNNSGDKQKCENPIVENEKAEQRNGLYPHNCSELIIKCIMDDVVCNVVSKAEKNEDISSSKSLDFLTEQSKFQLHSQNSSKLIVDGIIRDVILNIVDRDTHVEELSSILHMENSLESNYTAINSECIVNTIVDDVILSIVKNHDNKENSSRALNCFIDKNIGDNQIEYLGSQLEESKHSEINSEYIVDSIIDDVILSLVTCQAGKESKAINCATFRGSHVEKLSKEETYLCVNDSKCIVDSIIDDVFLSVVANLANEGELPEEMNRVDDVEMEFKNKDSAIIVKSIMEDVLHEVVPNTEPLVELETQNIVSEILNELLDTITFAKEIKDEFRLLIDTAAKNDCGNFSLDRKYLELDDYSDDSVGDSFENVEADTMSDVDEEDTVSGEQIVDDILDDVLTNVIRFNDKDIIIGEIVEDIIHYVCDTHTIIEEIIDEVVDRTPYKEWSLVSEFGIKFASISLEKCQPLGSDCSESAKVQLMKSPKSYLDSLVEDLDIHIKTEPDLDLEPEESANYQEEIDIKPIVPPPEVLMSRTRSRRSFSPDLTTLLPLKKIKSEPRPRRVLAVSGPPPSRRGGRSKSSSQTKIQEKSPSKKEQWKAQSKKPAAKTNKAPISPKRKATRSAERPEPVKQVKVPKLPSKAKVEPKVLYKAPPPKAKSPRTTTPTPAPQAKRRRPSPPPPPPPEPRSKRKALPTPPAVRATRSNPTITPAPVPPTTRRSRKLSPPPEEIVPPPKRRTITPTLKVPPVPTAKTPATPVIKKNVALKSTSKPPQLSPYQIRRSRKHNFSAPHLNELSPGPSTDGLKEKPEEGSIKKCSIRMRRIAFMLPYDGGLCCDLCVPKRVFVSRAGLVEHVKLEHADITASSTTASSSSSSSGTDTCPQCKKKFHSHNRLIAHIKTCIAAAESQAAAARPIEKEMNYKCDTCGKKFSCWSALESHKRCHWGYKPNSDAGDQVDEVAGSNTHTTTYESEMMRRGKGLKMTIRREKVEPQLVLCNICNAPFDNIDTLRLHQFIHRKVNVKQERESPEIEILEEYIAPPPVAPVSSIPVAPVAPFASTHCYPAPPASEQSSYAIQPAPSRAYSMETHVQLRQSAADPLAETRGFTRRVNEDSLAQWDDLAKRVGEPRAQVWDDPVPVPVRRPQPQTRVVASKPVQPRGRRHDAVKEQNVEVTDYKRRVAMAPEGDWVEIPVRRVPPQPQSWKGAPKRHVETQEVYEESAPKKRMGSNWEDMVPKQQPQTQSLRDLSERNVKPERTVPKRRVDVDKVTAEVDAKRRAEPAGPSRNMPEPTYVQSRAQSWEEFAPIRLNPTARKSTGGRRVHSATARKSTTRRNGPKRIFLSFHDEEII